MPSQDKVDNDLQLSIYLKAFLARYPKAKVGDFDGDPAKLTEMDALVSYLQMLGTLVDFSTYDDATGYR
mgnify:CR=1 FL=1